MEDTISRFMAADHRECDRLLAACEIAASASDWALADETVTRFRDALLHHFALEEDTLFPELLDVNGAAAGPVGVMRTEHLQMRQLVDDLAADLEAQDRDACLGDLETLHMLSQQHNAKEEAVLYPMADLSLSATAGGLVARMQQA
jgi:iron-sulfur cluster repair protein YtfE (RIC family)